MIFLGPVSCDLTIRFFRDRTTSYQHVMTFIVASKPPRAKPTSHFPSLSYSFSLSYFQLHTSSLFLFSETLAVQFDKRLRFDCRRSSAQTLRWGFPSDMTGALKLTESVTVFALYLGLINVKCRLRSLRTICSSRRACI